MCEGGESGGNVLPIEGADAEILRHMLLTLMADRRTAASYRLRNDHAWPRSALATARRVVGKAGGVIGESLTGSGEDQASLPRRRRRAAGRLAYGRLSRITTLRESRIRKRLSQAKLSERRAVVRDLTETTET